MLSLRQTSVLAFTAVSLVQGIVTFKDVYADLQAADATTKKIIAAEQSFTNCENPLTTLQAYFVQHLNQIKQAGTDTAASPPPTAAEYQNDVISFYCGQGKADVIQVLNGLKAKRALVVSCNAAGTICSDLTQLRTYFITLFNNLANKAPNASLRSQEQTCANQMVQALQDAIAYYGC